MTSCCARLARLLMVLFLSLPGLAAAEPPSGVVLEFNGQVLLTLTARMGAVQPAERVRLIGERLQRLSNDRLLEFESIVAREDGEFGWGIYAGDQLLMVITREDAKANGVSDRMVAETVALRLREILRQDREAKSPRELLIKVMSAGAYTVAFVLIILVLLRLFREARQRVDAAEGTLIRSLKFKTFEVLPASRIIQMALVAIGLMRVVCLAALFYFFIPLVLSLFPWTAKHAAQLIDYVVAPVKDLAHSIVAVVPNLMVIVLNVFVARYALKMIRAFFGELAKGTLRLSGFYPEWAATTYQIVRVLVIAFTLAVSFPYLPGAKSPAVQGISMLLGVLLSFASSGAVANVIAGLSLTYMRSFQIGDRVKIADSEGDVVEKTIFVTRIRTIKNIDISIPNAQVLANHIVNYSAMAAADGIILHSEVTIGYDAPWRRVHELLMDAARGTPNILASPAPFVLQTSLDDSYVRYQINAYTRDAMRMAETYSALHQRIQDCFNAAGVEIMSPAYSAIRDGNTVTIPAAHRSAAYRAPAFRVNAMQGAFADDRTNGRDDGLNEEQYSASLGGRTQGGDKNTMVVSSPISS